MSEWDVVEESATPQTGPQDQDDDTITTGSTPDDNPWAVESTEPTAQASPEGEGSEWDVEGTQSASGGEWSKAGSFAAGAAKGAVPAIGGLAAGLSAGAAVVGPATIAAAPLGPFAPIAGGAAGIVAGLGVGMGAGALLDAAQDKFLALMDWNKPLEEAHTANPRTFELGQMAPAAALLRPNGTMIQRGVGAAIGGVAEAGMQVASGEFDPVKIGMAAGMGAALPSANAAGSKVIAAGDQIGERLSNKLYRGEGGRYRGGNKNPDLKEVPTEEGQPQEAQAPQEDEITVANDEPNVAAGVSVEQQAAPVIEGAGNPEGAPMAAREAARATDPERNYAKDQPQTQPGTTESKVIDTEPLKSDIKAALDGERQTEQTPQPEGTDVLPQEAAPPVQPEQDNHTPGVREQAQIPNSLGEVETSRAQRERVGDVQERMAASQKGEDFQGLEKTEPEALTPAERKTLAEDRKLLAQAGWDRALGALDKVAPRQQLEFLGQHANDARQAIAEAEGKKKSEAESRRAGRAHGNVAKESRSKVSTGVLARSKADAQRKESALAHVNSMYEEFGPRSEKGKAIDTTDPQAMEAYADQVWKEAVGRNEGRDPVLRSPQQYVPLQKGAHEDAYQWLKALKSLTLNANDSAHKRFATLHSVEGMGKLDAETGRVEGDRLHRPTVDEKGGEAETATGAMEHSRSTFEHIEPDPRPNADNSYVEDHNSLADWINERTPTEYKKLAEKYDLRAEMDEPADPRELLGDMKQTLADTGKRPKGELTSEVELPAQRVKAPSLPQKEEAAPAGKVLDKNSDEFKRLAAMYEQNAPKDKPRTAAEQVAALKDKEASYAKAGSWSDLAEQFAKDEGGSAKIPAFLTPNPVFHNPVAKEAVEHLNKEFNISMSAISNTETRLMASFVGAQDRPSIAARREMYKKAETNQPFTADEQTYFDNTIQPLKDWYARSINLAEKAGLLPDDFTRYLGVTARHVPRMAEPDPIGRSNDAPWRRQFSTEADPLKNREFFSLDDGAGKRLLFKMNDDGDMVIFRNKAMSTIKKLPPTFAGKLGDTLPLKIKGVQNKFTVDHATTNEIESNVQDMTHVKDLELAYSNAVQKIQGALIRDNIIKRIKADPRMESLSTKSAEVARDKGWDLEPTTLKELARDKHGHPIYYDPKVRWWMDDMARPGIDDYDFMRKVNNAAAALAKPLYFTSPLFHPLNVAQNWALAMGQDALRFRTYPRIASEAMNAIKEVFTQGPLNQEYAAAGGRPMLHTQLMDGGLMSQLMMKAGYSVPHKPSIFDPLSKATGIPVADILHEGMRFSNKLTWGPNDMFALSLYQRNKRMGMSPREAVDATERWIGAYRPDSQTFGGSRVAQKLLNTPALSWFGPYHQDLWRSIGNIAKGLTTHSGDPQMRREAIGALAMGSFMMFVVYPKLLDEGAKLISGNENAEFGRRGLLAVSDATMHMVKGDRDHTRLMQNVLTPSIPANLVMQGITNKDWRGQEVAPAGPLYQPQHAAKTAARLTDWGLGLAVPPIGSINAEARQEEGGVLPWAKKFMEAGIGIKDPTEGSVKFEENRERTQNRVEKQRGKKPGGVIETGINRLYD